MNSIDCALYSDPQLYDLLFPGARDTESVHDPVRSERIIASERFYVEEARRSGGRVLELGCGSGRLTVPIAKSGVEICGADLSEPMLDAARAKALEAGVQVPFVRADMRTFDMPGPFAAILIPGNSLLHLFTIADLKACLRAVRRHFAPGGRLIFDISKWDIAQLARDCRQRYPVLSLEDADRGEITIEETATYNAAEQVREIVWYLSSPGERDFRAIEYRLRVIFPEELLLLIEIAGFELEARFGEFTRAPFDASSPRQVCICSAGQ